MTVGGSQQLRLYRRARRDGATMMTACVESGIGMEEARLIDAGDLASPPPPEAYELLQIPAVEAAPPEEEPTMARPRKQETVEEIGKPDFALAKRIYQQDIKPAQSRVGEFAQEQSTAFKAIKKTAYIQPAAAKAVFKLVEMEESKRDDFLRSFNGLLREFQIFMPADLVDVAEGKAKVGADVVPIGTAKRESGLVTLQGPEDDQDLIDAAEGLGGDAEHPQAAE